MKFESSKIVMIGKSELHDVQLAYQIFEMLDESVIETIENGKLKLWIYAEIFRDCLAYKETFSDEVAKRLKDQNYITTKMSEYDRRHK